MKVLIVDDEYANRELLKHLLRHYGTCTEAADGAEAVTLFKEALIGGKPFDLVFMDIIMPKLDGQQALKEIRLAEKAMYGPSLSGPSLDANNYSCIIMVTSLDDPCQLIEAYTKGKCNGYINKPIIAKDIVQKLKSNNLII